MTILAPHALLLFSVLVCGTPTEATEPGNRFTGHAPSTTRGAESRAAQPADRGHASERTPSVQFSTRPPTNLPEQAPRPTTKPSAATSVSTSIGSTAEGSLRGATALPPSGPGFRHNPLKLALRRYGTVELVSAIMRAAARVNRLLPGGELTINDISQAAGGEISGHATHRSGRDVDVLFYALDEHNRPRPGHAVPIEPDGSGVDYRDLSVADDDVPVSIDVPRTWLFLESLALDPDAHIQQVYVAEHVRTLLLDHAASTGAPIAAIERLGHLTCQPRFPHDDHLHIRFFCTPDDIRAGCRDNRPIHPWHRAHLQLSGVRPTLAGPRRGAPSKLTSTKAARAKAGPMHAEVEAFLGRRRHWEKKPHPGRRYCP
ncbi:MAG: penicillin-insensitive murein endopeptidase [Nannocystaceae bacterium]